MVCSLSIGVLNAASRTVVTRNDTASRRAEQDDLVPDMITDIFGRDVVFGPADFLVWKERCARLPRFRYFEV